MTVLIRTLTTCLSTYKLELKPSDLVELYLFLPMIYDHVSSDHGEIEF